MQTTAKETGEEVLDETLNYLDEVLTKYTGRDLDTVKSIATDTEALKTAITEAPAQKPAIYRAAALNAAVATLAIASFLLHPGLFTMLTTMMLGMLAVTAAALLVLIGLYLDAEAVVKRRGISHE